MIYAVKDLGLKSLIKRDVGRRIYAVKDPGLKSPIKRDAGRRICAVEDPGLKSPVKRDVGKRICAMVRPGPLISFNWSTRMKIDVISIPGGNAGERIFANLIAALKKSTW